MGSIVPIHAFITTHKSLKKPFSLKASSGPQYEKIDGVLRDKSILAEGSVMLHVEVTGDKTLDYKPGHVIALEIEDKEDPSGEWMRGPYTISRCSESSFDIMIKTVGKKSKAFANAIPMTPIKFGGKFKVPILDGIEKSSIENICLMSTGVGIGPMIGAIELALDDGSYPPIELFALFKSSSEVVCKEYLDSLAGKYPGQFCWTAIISEVDGRISSNSNLEKFFGKGINYKNFHFHLIGNGQMVNEWRAGLIQGGLPEEQITIEQYFNHKAVVNEEVIERIASSLFKENVVQNY